MVVIRVVTSEAERVPDGRLSLSTLLEPKI